VLADFVIVKFDMSQLWHVESAVAERCLILLFVGD